jgi:surface protein
MIPSLERIVCVCVLDDHNGPAVRAKHGAVLSRRSSEGIDLLSLSGVRQAQVHSADENSTALHSSQIFRHHASYEHPRHCRAPPPSLRPRPACGRRSGRTTPTRPAPSRRTAPSPAGTSRLLPSELFYGLQNFNADISNWNTSSVTNMASMFLFNQPLSLSTRPASRACATHVRLRVGLRPAAELRHMSSVTDMGYMHMHMFGGRFARTSTRPASRPRAAFMFRVRSARALTPPPSDSQGLYAGAAAGGILCGRAPPRCRGVLLSCCSESVAPRGVRWSASLLRARDQRHAQHIRKREITVHTDARGCVLRTSRPSSMEGRLPTPFCLDSPGTRIAPGARSRIHRIPDDLLHVAEFGCQS